MVLTSVCTCSAWYTAGAQSVHMEDRTAALRVRVSTTRGLGLASAPGQLRGRMGALSSDSGEPAWAEPGSGSREAATEKWEPSRAVPVGGPASGTPDMLVTTLLQPPSWSQAAAGVSPRTVPTQMSSPTLAFMMVHCRELLSWS